MGSETEIHSTWCAHACQCHVPTCPHVLQLICIHASTGGFSSWRLDAYAWLYLKLQLRGSIIWIDVRASASRSDQCTQEIYHHSCNCQRCICVCQRTADCDQHVIRTSHSLPRRPCEEVIHIQPYTTLEQVHTCQYQYTDRCVAKRVWHCNN